MKKNDLSLEDRFWSKVDAKDDMSACWNWKRAKNEKGYGKFYLNGKMERSHRVAWILTNGEIPNNLWVLHKCIKNPECCNPNHLYLGTPVDNSRDSIRDGTSSIFNICGKLGENSSHHKLSLVQVDEIKEKLNLGYMEKVLASEYNVAQSTISNIKCGINWSLNGTRK